jgi:ABC-type branched-subunit amino acid transport system substrate-binding protein
MFVANHRAAFPDESVGWVSLHAYEATHVLLTALSAAAVPTATYVADALTQTDFYGVSGYVNFDETGEWTTPQLSVYTWRHGRRVQP